MSFRSALAIVVMSLVACGSPPPSAVDEEMLLVDVGACARGEAICERSGAIGGGALLVEAEHGVVMDTRPLCGSQKCDLAGEDCCAGTTQCKPKGTCSTGVVPVVHEPARFSLPIRKPSEDARLAWIAIGMSAGGGPRKLRITLDGKDESVFEPSVGWARIELNGRDATPAAGARLEVTAVEGVVGVAWIVGRWKR